jgi:predicted transcriptional regulator
MKLKLKKVRIIVEPLKDTSERWLKALQGKAKSISTEEVITVSSWEILGKILSPPRLQILTMIPVLKPKSISALAKALKKDFKNVYSDAKFLADLGLIELKEEGNRKTLIPIAKFNGIELGLAA